MNCIKLLGAINKDTGKYTSPKFASKNNKYKCPGCLRDLIFRQGKIKVPHFAHKKANDPCKFYINPSETQIHKDAKFLLKSIIENNINLKIKRNCICCNDTIHEYIIPQYNDTFKVCIEYKIKHNNKTKYIDVAYIDENNNIIALFEICYKNKTCEEDRPDPWYEFNAEKFIDIVNRNTEINELTIECIRKHKCAKCIADINEDNKKHEEAKIKLAKMIPYDKDDRWKNNLFIDYPKLNIDEYFQGCLMLDTQISYKDIKKYIPEHIYNSIENVECLINSSLEDQYSKIIKYIPHNPQLLDGNFVPTFELCKELKFKPYIEVDIAVSRKGEIQEIWISEYIDEMVISKLLKYTNNCTIYVFNVNWILEQDNNLLQEDFYNNAKKVAQCYQIKPLELRELNIEFDNTNIYLKVPFNKKDKAKDLGAKWDNDHKLWYIKNTNKKKEYILCLFNQIFFRLSNNAKILKKQIVTNKINLFEQNINKINWYELSRNSNAFELLVKNPDKIIWYLLSANPNAIELLKENKNNIDWEYLSINSNNKAIELLRENPDKIRWNWLSCNPCNEAIELLKLNLDKINWSYLSSNPSIKAIELLKENPDKINWDNLLRNPNNIALLKKNKDKINWIILSENPNDKAIKLLKLNLDKINWSYLSKNPNDKAIELLKENPDKINWDNLSSNPNDKAIELLKENQDKINWRNLSSNPNDKAIELLKENQDKINWTNLSENLNDKAIELLKKNKDKIVWIKLSSNPNNKAIELLQKYPKKISWYNLSSNPNIMEILNKII